MGFQNPLALWGLALLAVPLYIHFFGFRLRRKAYFTRLDWLLQQQIPVQQRERLFRYLLLATRILAVLMLVAALAGPTSSSPDSLHSVGSRCMIYVDNSRGMAMEGSGGPLLEQA
ncbi:MAG: BatA domain-containing protein, partial [Bacteroidota bacterium]